MIRSYAKINLTLDVLGKRTDGYHELATVMQTIDLYDTLTLSECDEDSVQVHCTRPELATEENLVVRAAQAVRQRLGLKQGMIIELQKQVPVSAGLGGGSSNAAAILLALQRWWQLPLAYTDLWAIAASLGADIPFFLTGGLAFCQGRGERVTPLEACWPASMRHLLLLKPRIGVSTRAVYRSLPSSDYTDGEHSRVVRKALEKRQVFSLEDVHNSLERGVLECYPEVAKAKADLFAAGASFVRLSGSGPTLFAPFERLSAAHNARQRLSEQGYEVYLTHPCFPEENDDICLL